MHTCQKFQLNKVKINQLPLMTCIRCTKMECAILASKATRYGEWENLLWQLQDDNALSSKMIPATSQEIKPLAMVKSFLTTSHRHTIWIKHDYKLRNLQLIKDWIKLITWWLKGLLRAIHSPQKQMPVLQLKETPHTHANPCRKR